MLQWALTTFVKGMKIGLRKNWLSILAEREVPSVEIDDGMVNLWLIMMDMGLCHEGRVPPLAPTHSTTLNPTLSHNMFQNLTNNTQQHQYHYQYHSK